MSRVAPAGVATVGALIDAMAARLDAAGVAYGHGTTNAADEAAWLVLWQLGLPLDAPGTVANVDNEPVGADASAAVEALVERRIATRQPAAYLTGEAWLQGVPFDIDPRAIVPRSPIAELLADGSLEPWLVAAPRRVLDLCTGNGSLAVLAALAWPDATVDASDVSADALAVAARNVERHRLQARIALRQGDGLAAAAGRYDVVLCNPPYVTAAAMAALPPEYRAEPALALAGGADGMAFVRPLIAGVSLQMADDGIVVLEVGHGRAAFEAAFPRLEPVWLSSSAGDDQVLLLPRAALPGAARRPG